MSKKIYKKTLIAVVCLWALVGMAYTVNAQPATMAPAARPAAMVVARPAPRPAARPVAMRVAPRPVARRAAARPAPMPVAAAPMSTMTAAAPAMAAPIATMAAAAPAMAPEKAAAPAAKKDTKGQVVGSWILQMVLYLIGIFLTAFIPVFTAWLYKKFKLADLEQKDKIDAMVTKAALFGIGKAEEQAYKLRDNPMDSAKKLDLAVKKANDYLVDSGLPQKGANYLADLVEAKLSETRTGDKKPAEKPAEKPEAADKPEKEDKPKEGDDK